MKLERLIYILLALLNKKQITAKEIAERFEISTRTVYRDMDTLSLVGIPIYSERGDKGGFYIPDDYKMDSSFFTEEEKQEVFRQVATKVQWLEGNKKTVLQFLLKNEEVRELFEVAQEDLEEEITEEQFCEAVYFYDLYCEVGEDLVCTFDVDTDPDYFLGHLVNIRLDDNYRLHLETISG